MKEFFFKSSFLILVIPLFSCSKLQYIDNYVGIYKVTTAVETSYHYYWGERRETGSKSLPGLMGIVTINKTGEVLFKDKDGMETKGGIKTSSKDCSFTGLNIDPSYKFKIVNDSEGRKTLDYSYTEDKHLVEYDYISRRYILTEYFDPHDFKNMIGEYKITNSTYKKTWHHDKTSQIVSKSDNYNLLVNGSLKINEDKTIQIIDGYKSKTQNGTVSVNNALLYFTLNDEEPLIRKDLKFIFSTSSKVFSIYGNDSFKEEIGEANYYIHNYYISMEKI